MRIASEMALWRGVHVLSEDVGGRGKRYTCYLGQHVDKNTWNTINEQRHPNLHTFVYHTPSIIQA